MKIIAILICIFSLVIPLKAEESTILQRIESAYKDISDIKGRFRQKSFIKDLQKKETYSGEFFIKIPHNFRWSYKAPHHQEVIISGKTIIIYQKKEKQAIKGVFDPSRYGEAPIALLGGLGDLSRNFNIQEEKSRLILTPKGRMGNIKTIEVYPDDGEFPVRSLKIRDKVDNTIEIFLEDVRINSGLSEDLFRFSPPKDVQIIEGLY